MLEIKCPCGSAHLRIKGEPLAQFWCHCSDCQQVHGGAYVAEAIYSAENVELSDGKTVVYISDRDGFNCIWEQPVSGGAARALSHFHRMRVSPVHLSRMAFNLSVGQDSFIYNAGDLRSNVWIARP